MLFPDKSLIYDLAMRVLKPGGTLAFLEAACDMPIRLRTQDHIGPVRYESAERYSGLLAAAGFVSIQSQDTKAMALHDVTSSLCRPLSQKDQVIAAVGKEVHFPLLEIWAEFAAGFTQGKLTHVGFIAKKAG